MTTKADLNFTTKLYAAVDAYEIQNGSPVNSTTMVDLSLCNSMVEIADAPRP